MINEQMNIGAYMENGSNISEMLEQILSTDEGKQAYDQLNQIFGDNNADFSGMFSQNDAKANENSGKNNTHSTKNTSGNSSSFNGMDPEMMMKFGKIFSEMNKGDKNTDLLMALKPHLQVENQHKVDSAMKIARLVSLFPHIKDSGMLDSFFG